jgi:hypothetical protein
MLATILFSTSLSSHLLSKYVKIKINKTETSPGVLYGYETWSFIQTDEHRLRMSENRVLRRIFGHEREEVGVDWRRLHSVRSSYTLHQISFR